MANSERRAPVRALRAWLAVLPDERTAVFRRMSGWGTLTRARLTVQTVALIVAATQPPSDHGRSLCICQATFSCASPDADYVPLMGHVGRPAEIRWRARWLAGSSPTNREGWTRARASTTQRQRISSAEQRVEAQLLVQPPGLTGGGAARWPTGQSSRAASVCSDPVRPHALTSRLGR
jgi:hypothetical protein